MPTELEKFKMLHNFNNGLIYIKRQLNPVDIANREMKIAKLQSGMPEQQERTISLTEKQAGTPETSH